MKLLTVVIPSYNSEAYLAHCVESLLPGGEIVEIIIVNDGSKDRTAEIADEYERRYPGIVRAIHQENKGHGGAVNTGLAHAAGLYFKVVDSDDKVDLSAYKKILYTLQRMNEQGKQVDMMLSNYVYDKVGAKKKKVIQYRNALPQNRIFGWNQVGNFRKGQYILMHSVIYRTQVLKTCGLKLPEHTFYVDNLFVYYPLPYVKKMFYLDVDFYLYFIGREDQSVNEKNMIKRVDQQLLVNRRMIEAYDLNRIQNPRLRKYMYNYLEIITTVSSIILIRAKTDVALDKKKALWDALKEKDKKLYRKMRYGLFGIVMNLPGSLGRGFAVTAYKIVQFFYGFN